MYLYNVTLKVDTTINAEWLTWMKEIHIPEVIATGCFSDYKMLQLLELDDKDGITYAVQYFAPAEKHYRDYIAQHAPKLRDDGIKLWGDKVVSFRTLMKIIS